MTTRDHVVDALVRDLAAAWGKPEAYVRECHGLNPPRPHWAEDSPKWADVPLFPTEQGETR